MNNILGDEYFELTFFAVKNSKNMVVNIQKIIKLLMISEGRNLFKKHKFALFSNREVLFDVFEETDFIEYRVCLANFVITKKNFEVILDQLFHVVDICFSGISSIQFATGIYELTYYIIENIQLFGDFDRNVFRKFPLVFFRNNNTYGMKPTWKYNEVSLVMNTEEKQQNIFID